MSVGNIEELRPNDIENLYARRSYRYAWKNSLLQTLYIDLEHTQQLAPQHALCMLCSFSGYYRVSVIAKLTKTRKLLLVVMLFTLTTSTYSLYSSTSYLMIQEARGKCRNCAGLTQRTTKPVRF